MFPELLDGAKVLLYTVFGNYAYVRYTTGDIFNAVNYFAVCQYKNDDDFYLFGCNAYFEVISDYICKNVEECQELVQSFSCEKLHWSSF